MEHADPIYNYAMEFDRGIFVKSYLMGNGLFLPQCHGEQILLVV